MKNVENFKGKNKKLTNLRFEILKTTLNFTAIFNIFLWRFPQFTFLRTLYFHYPNNFHVNCSEKLEKLLKNKAKLLPHRSSKNQFDVHFLLSLQTAGFDVLDMTIVFKAQKLISKAAFYMFNNFTSFAFVECFRSFFGINSRAAFIFVRWKLKAFCCNALLNVNKNRKWRAVFNLTEGIRESVWILMEIFQTKLNIFTHKTLNQFMEFRKHQWLFIYTQQCITKCLEIYSSVNQLFAKC